MAERLSLSDKALAAPVDNAQLGVKPRFRVPAGSSATATTDKAWANQDSFQNFLTALGLGTNNQQSASTYGFNPITRNHILLEWMYRGSWLVKRIVDCPADDMTREGITYTSDMTPAQLDGFDKYMGDLALWQKLNQGLKWSNLYGGACCYFDIDGQRPDTPLRVETIGKGQFRGLIVLDRWMIWPHLNDLVMEPGPHFGKPKFYDVVADGLAIPRMRIHYSRLIRFEGVELPYWQAQTENLWGLSVIEPLYDRLVAFDSASTGASQLVYKAHLRTMTVEGLRNLIAEGGQIYNAFLQQIGVIRTLQNNEGLTIIDAKDKFETHQYSFSGLTDVLLQFAQQLAGASEIPLTVLFGQSPAGLNATGDNDLRNYYDRMHSRQETRLRLPLQMVLECASRSYFGKSLPEGFGFTFNPLWQMTVPEKVKAASDIVTAIMAAFDGGLISQQIALKELKQSSSYTGVFTNITQDDINDADDEPPAPGLGLSDPPASGSPSPAVPGAKGSGPSAGIRQQQEGATKRPAPDKID
jgi:phage-related protein (TIGR01555 family)